MRIILIKEIENEKPNSSALGAMNDAVSSLSNGYIVGRVNGSNKDPNFGNKVSSVKYSKKALNKIVNK